MPSLNTLSLLLVLLSFEAVVLGATPSARSIRLHRRDVNSYVKLPIDSPTVGLHTMRNLRRSTGYHSPQQLRSAAQAHDTRAARAASRRDNNPHQANLDAHKKKLQDAADAWTKAKEARQAAGVHDRRFSGLQQAESAAMSAHGDAKVAHDKVKAEFDAHYNEHNRVVQHETSEATNKRAEAARLERLIGAAGI